MIHNFDDFLLTKIYDSVIKYTPSGGVDYSPSNIKRIVISPDVVSVHYHIPVNNCKSRSFNIAGIYNDAIRQEKPYAPLIRLIQNPYVLSAVEEVIFLSQSKHNGLYLRDYDYNVGYLVGSAVDVSSSIGRKFSRLRRIAMLNMSYDDFVSKLNSCYTFPTDLVGTISVDKIKKCNLDWKNRSTLLTDLEPFSDFMVLYQVNDDNWYRGWRGAGKFYANDMNGGIIFELMHRFEVEYDKQFKREKVNELSNKLDTEANEKFANLYKELQKFQRAYSRFYNICSSVGCNELFSMNDFVKLPSIALYPCDYLKDKKVQLLESVGTERERISNNTETIKSYVRQCAIVINDMLVNSLVKLQGTSRLLFLTMFYKRDSIKFLSIAQNAVAIDSLTKDLSTIPNFRCYNGSITGSLPVIYETFCFLFLDRTSEKFRSEYVTKEFWEEVANNAE